jgi:metallo-beta-lactamase class B
MKSLTLALALLAAPALRAQPTPTMRSWNRPVDPYRIAGPVYSVGASDITSFLITTSEGHVLVNSGFVETAPIIEANVRRLGFRLEDVKLILASHAHFDHVGGHAALRARTGARVLVSEGDAEAVRTGGRIFDPGGGGYTWPSCPVDRVLHDGEVVTLGGVAFTARATPGHTKGATTWLFDVAEGARSLRVAVYSSMSALPGVLLEGNPEYPGIAEDYARSFRALREMRPDVVLAPHASLYGAEEKARRLRAGEAGNPFVDPGLWTELIDRQERAFRERLDEQKAARRGKVHAEVPDSIDPGARYLLYLHGRILEREGRRAVSPDFGAYELDSILASLAARGFEVIADVRTSEVGREYALQVADRVGRLLKAGVPPSNVLVVGASKGGWLALETAAALGRDDLAFVVLAGCGPNTVELGPRLRGRVLSVMDRSDRPDVSCESTFAAAPRLRGRKQVVTDLGLGHGLVYNPLLEWLDPLGEWAATGGAQRGVTLAR